MLVQVILSIQSGSKIHKTTYDKFVRFRNFQMHVYIITVVIFDLQQCLLQTTKYVVLKILRDSKAVT